MLFLGTLTLSGHGAVSQNATAQDAASTIPHLPDLSSYNCVGVTDATASNTRHIGQVIKGSYYEWYESYVLADGKQQLACISLLRPATRQLSGDEAQTFLTDAFAVGAPAGNAAERTSSTTEITRPEDVEPEDVQPEPLKRVRKPPISIDGATGGSAEKKSGVSDLPPLPAGKNLSAAAPYTPPAPERERASSATSLAPTVAVETPATVGVEDREQIANAQAFPWNTLAYMSVTYPGGNNFRCSAAIVSPYVVLTAGHCVHNNTRGGYVTSARVYPGQNQAVLGDDNPIRPFGVKSNVSSVQTTAQWVQISGEETYLITDYRHDLGALEFSTPFTHTSTFMPVLYGSTGTPITSAGYPGEVQNKDSYGLYADLGAETTLSVSTLRSSHVREFQVDASGGNSGGPFFFTDPATSQRYLAGSLSYAEDLDDQFDLLVDIRDRLSQARRAVKQIARLRDQIGEWEQRSEDVADTGPLLDLAARIREALSAIEGRLITVKRPGEKGRLAQITEKLEALAPVVSSTDAAPTRQSNEVFEELASGLDDQVAALRDLIDNDLAAFVTMSGELGLPAIAP